MIRTATDAIEHVKNNPLEYKHIAKEVLWRKMFQWGQESALEKKREMILACAEEIAKVGNAEFRERMRRGVNDTMWGNGVRWEPKTLAEHLSEWWRKKVVDWDRKAGAK